MLEPDRILLSPVNARLIVLQVRHGISEIWGTRDETVMSRLLLKTP
jgi:hypothetical protein